MRHRDTIELYNYWNEVRDGQPAPHRSAIAPAGLGRLLPSVMLLQTDESGVPVFRLAGSRLCTLRCAELKDTPFAQLFAPDDAKQIEKGLNTVLRNGSLVVFDVQALRSASAGVAMEIALLPIDHERTRILGIASLFTQPEWLGIVPARFELRGVRYMDPLAGLSLLRNRPSVPVPRRRASDVKESAHNLQVIAGKGEIGPRRALRAFRVVDGGKK